MESPTGSPRPVSKGGEVRTCIYCGKTLGEVAKLRKRAGYRVPCYSRGTPKGFHEYYYTPDKEKLSLGGKMIRIIPQLKPFIDVPLAEKLPISKIVVERNLREMGKNCVATFSGGKDSLVELHLIIDKYPDIPVVFNNTGVEYPETIKYVRELTALWKLNLIETKPEKTFWECAKIYGFPKTKSNRTDHKSSRCCYWLKEKPMAIIMKSLKAKGYFTGVTAVENRNRQIRAITHGTCYKMKGTGEIKVHPILYWTAEDVWEYIKENNLPYNPMYDHPSKTVDRVGCSTCTAFKGWENQLSATNPKLYQLIKTRKDVSEGKLL